MDFVVIGLGLSALALLTGLTLLCLVAPRWFRQSGVVQPGDAAFARAQAGARHALGQGFLCVGAVLLLATLGGISAGLTDKAGAYLIASMATLAAFGLLGWDALYRRQHPIPQRRMAPARAKRTADGASASRPEGSPAAISTTARRRVLPARRHGASVAQPAVAAASVDPQADDSHASGDEPQPADVPEPVPGITETHTEPGEDAEPVSEDDAHAAEIVAAENADVGPKDEPASEGMAAAEPAEVAAAHPEPVPLHPETASGGDAPAASPAPGVEPDILPHGDDRVIALFPTAAARRGRTVVAPMDPDGKS